MDKNIASLIDYLGSEDFWKEVESESIILNELLSDNLILAGTHLNSIVRRKLLQTRKVGANYEV